jgi:hypothetical protein
VGSLNIDIYNNGSWTDDVLVITGKQQENSRDLWDEQLVDLSTYGDVIKVRFRAISGTGTSRTEINIDDINVVERPSCLNPTDIVASNVTYQSVDLSWTSNNDSNSTLEIEYGIVGFTPGSGTKIVPTENSLTIDGLMSHTQYDIYIRSICGEDYSELIGPILIKTLANFCNGDHFYDSGGKDNSYKNNENETTVIYPFDSDYVEVEFLDFQTESCCDRLTIYDGPDINSQQIGVYRGSTKPEGKIRSTHESGALTFVFSSDGSSVGRGWDVKVECVSISCPNPSNVFVSNIGGDEATLNWNKGGDETKWQLEYGAPNFNLGTGTNLLIDSNPYILKNLKEETNYEFYLKAVCGDNLGDDDSEWVGPYNFTTICNLHTAPFYEDFKSLSIPSCWVESGGEEWKFSKLAYYDAANADDHSPDGNTNYAWIDGSIPNGADHISKLKTPWIDISSLTTPSLEFSVYSVNTNDNTYNTFKVNVFDDLGSFVELYTLQESSKGWKTLSFDLSNLGLSNRIQVEFIVHENSPGNSYFNDILLDDVKVENNEALNLDIIIFSNFKYYPNPVSDNLVIESDETIDVIMVFNTLGQRILTKKNKQNSKKIDINFLSYPKGTYLVKAVSKSKFQSFRVIKK